MRKVATAVHKRSVFNLLTIRERVQPEAEIKLWSQRSLLFWQ